MRPQKQVTREELERERNSPPMLDRFRFAKSAALRRWKWLAESPLVTWEDFHQELHLACAAPYSTRFALRRAVDRAMNSLAIRSGFVRINGKYSTPRLSRKNQRVASAGQWHSMRNPELYMKGLAL